MVDKPDMSKCVNIEQYEKQIKHWQAFKIEQLEAENKALKEALKARYLDKTHAKTLLYPQDVVARNREIAKEALKAEQG